MTIMSNPFGDVFLSLAQPLTIVGAIVKSGEKSQTAAVAPVLTLLALLGWVAEGTLTWMAYGIMNVTASMGTGSALETITLLLFVRAIVVSLSIVTNLIVGLLGLNSEYIAYLPKNKPLLWALVVVEHASIIMPIIWLSVAQDDIKSTSCTDGIAEGDPFTVKSEDLGLTYAYMFHVISLGVRLARSYAIAASNATGPFGIFAEGEYDVVSSGGSMSSWNQRKREYASIRKNAREEVTYNFNQSNGIARHDLI